MVWIAVATISADPLGTWASTQEVHPAALPGRAVHDRLDRAA